MQTIPLDAVPVAGAVDRDVTAGGIVFRRSPAALRHQLDPGLLMLVTMPAGVRIELLTDAHEIELDVLVTVLDVQGMMSFPAVFDLVVGGSLRASATASGGNRVVIDPQTLSREFVAGSPSTIQFSDLPGDPNVCVEIWMPHRSVAELRAVRISGGATFRAPPPRRRWVHYGSSISHCLEVDHPTDAWPTITAQLGDVDLVNLGVAGQCMLDQHVARTIRDLHADVISLKVGVNIVGEKAMSERAFVPTLHGFLDTIRERNPDTPIVVVSPIACPRFDARDSAVAELTISRVRELVSEVVAIRRAVGHSQVHFLNGLALLGHDEIEDLPDGLHPNAAGYRRIGERFHALAFGSGGPFHPASN